MNRPMRFLPTTLEHFHPGRFRVLMLWSVSLALMQTAASLAEPAEYPAGTDARPNQAPVSSPPSSLPKAPAFPPPQGEVKRVGTVEELFAAVERASEPGTTILLADGHYRLPRVLVLEQKRQLTLRSASGNPDKVVLSGRGWSSEAKN